MNRFTTVLALAVAGGLLTPVPAAHAASDCADQAHPIGGRSAVDASVGTSKVVRVDLDVWVLAGCGVDEVVATLVAPSDKAFRVDLAPQPGDGDQVRWSGTLVLDPARLSNADAGTWDLRYDATGPAVDDTATAEAVVRRATRLAFDAGPEPVRNGRITFTGTLERASWASKRYRPVSRSVVVRRHEVGGDAEIGVARATTSTGGKFRKTVAFPGTNTYWADFDGDRVSARAHSRTDRVKGR